MMTSVRPGMNLILAALAYAACLAIPTTARAHAGNDDPNAVHACVGNIKKLVRIVGVDGSCYTSPVKRAETPAHWTLDATRARADGPCFSDVSRFADCGNGSITDTVTGLIWLTQWDCLPATTWAAANLAASSLGEGVCGLADGSSPGDWRLPTKEEWAATDLAPGAPPFAFFWSSTSEPDGSSAWVWSLALGGGIAPKTAGFLGMPVRSSRR